MKIKQQIFFNAPFLYVSVKLEAFLFLNQPTSSLSSRYIYYYTDKIVKLN